LYHLAHDPDERDNLADRADHEATRRKLDAALQEWFVRYVDPALDGTHEPVTGEGIGFAIESGRLAARAVADALAHGTPGRAAATYAAAFRPLYRHMRQASCARWLLFPQPCLRRAMRALSHHPQLVRMFMEVLAGDLSYPEYFRRMFVGRLMRRL